jgi:hypothetical protein
MFERNINLKFEIWPKVDMACQHFSDIGSAFHLKNDVLGKRQRGNCKSGPLLKSNAENGSLFSTLHDQSSFSKMKVPSSTVLDYVSRFGFLKLKKEKL